jgi:glycosyltransferase involved in cell wall biosynthesis
MGLKKSSVFLTAHWTENKFKPSQPAKKALFGLDPETPVLLFAGRVSKEKGTDELAEIYAGIKAQIPKLKLVVAGTGPDEAFLKEAIPDAIFLGWVAHDKLPQIYSSADLLILPSRFDTFSLVVLEALSCGLPVIAYKTKGPKDIIKHEESGFLAVNKEDMISMSLSYFQGNEKGKFKDEALKRSQTYSSKKIIKRLIRDVGLYSSSKS